MLTADIIKTQKPRKYFGIYAVFLVPMVGVGPTRYFYHGILR